MKKLLKIVPLFICLLFSIYANADDRISQMKLKLEAMVVDMPGLDETVELSVNGVSIQDFIRGIADAHKLNISVDPSINQTVVNNFSNATVNDVLVFICKEYDLDINFIGSILSVVKFKAPLKVEPVKTIKPIGITYQSSTDKLSLDLKQDSLELVAKIITQKSKKNLVLSPGIGQQLVNAYIEEMPFENALEKFAFSNNLTITKTEDNFYLVEKMESFSDNSKNPSSDKTKNSKIGQGNTKTQPSTSDYTSTIVDLNNISIYGVDVLIGDLIRDVSKELNINYFLLADLKEKTTVNVQNTTYQAMLNHVLQGTNYTYEIRNGIYIIGERKTEGLRSVRVVQLQHRTVEKVIDFIPADIKQDVTVKEFADLNSVILSGSTPNIDEIEKFMKSVDKTVPVILIEVMIIDYTNKRTNTSGIKVGLGANPATTGGTVYPNLDMSLGSSSINSLIESFNGYGILNLGKVTPNFYININELETQGILRVKSTPKLATLNGHDANMSIGNTAYYYEEQQTTTSNTATNTIKTRTYKSVNADLSVKIKPYVSGDGQVTLEIAVKQSDFTEKIEPGAPPGSVSRDFTSMIRVKDQEMILLGGLEEKSIRESGSGVPFLSRIPIIKWFFSNRSREKSRSKLNIFIKPTIIY